MKILIALKRTRTFRSLKVGKGVALVAGADRKINFDLGCFHLDKCDSIEIPFGAQSA